MESIEFDSDEYARGPQNDSASSLLVPVLRSRWLVCVLLLLGLIGGVAYGVIQPNTYSSVGKLLVRYGQREEVTPETILSGPGQQAFAQPRNLVNNEIELLSVPLVFERVARVVTPRRLTSPYDPGAEDGPETSRPLLLFHKFQAWWFRRASAESSTKVGHATDDCVVCVTEAAHDLALNLKLTAEPESSVITVSYTAHDPALAREVVGAFLNAAEERHRESYNANSTLEFVSERVKASLSEVQDAERAFSEYRLACDVIDYDSQRAQLLTQVHDLENQAAEDSNMLAKLRSREGVLVGLLAELPATVQQEVERDPLANPRWNLLQQRLFTLQDSVVQLNSRVGGTTADREAAHGALEQQIALTTEEMKDVPALIPQKPTIQNVVNLRHQRLTQELDDLKLDIAARQSVAEQSAQRLKSVRNRQITTEQCEAQYHFLQATARNARARYDAFDKAHERTSVMSLLDQLEFSNLRRIQEATLPFEKEGPKRAKFLLVGLLLGGFAGVALAFGKHTVDPFVRTPSDVEHQLGLKLVGVTTHSRLPWRLRRAIRRAIRSAAL